MTTLRNLLSLLIGLVFGLGLCLSQMTQPAKVQGFLDIAGAWDPSLAFVMGGAIAVGLVGFNFAKRRRRTLLGDPCQLPAQGRVDARLISGAAIFGVGWGLAGVCPGPAVVNVASLDAGAMLFFVAMLIGMAAERLVLNALAGRNGAVVEED
jgi:uncharacterized membrane protein YedE/YeeE